MSQVAKGQAVAIALAPERNFNVPAAGLVSYDPILPVAAGIVGTETDSGQVNRSAFLKKGLPGQKQGEFQMGLPLTAGHLIEFFAHIFGKVVKASPGAGVYTYTCTPVLTAQHMRSLWGVFGREPVERELVHGIRLGSLALAIADNVEIPLTMQGLIAHGTRLGLSVPDAGNTGTYALSPYVRGVLADESAGDVFVQVSRLPAGGGLQFKVEQTAAAPAFEGDAVDMVYDTTGEGTWRQLQDHDGRDLGIMDENKDPLELVFPGTAGDHDNLAIGDVFQFQAPGTWALPPLTTLPAAPRFTSAHWLVRARQIGAGSYTEVDANTGSLTLEYAVEADRGNGSRYPFDIIRPGTFNPTMQLARSLTDRYFADFYDRHQRLDLQLAFEGRQIGASYAYREGIEITMPSAGINENARPAAAPGKITETNNFKGETDDAGADPCTVVITTTRDWTVV